MSKMFSIRPLAGVHVQEFREQFNGRLGTNVNRFHKRNCECSEELQRERQTLYIANQWTMRGYRANLHI